MSVLSLIFGTLSVISSLVFMWNAWYITVVISLSGIVTGFLSLKSASHPSVSKAGIILSFIGLGLTAVFILAYGIIANFFLEMAA